MKLFNILAATAAASPALDCDVSSMFSNTCALSGFDLSLVASPSSDCQALIADGDFSVVVVAPGAQAPGNAAQTCASTTLGTGFTHAVMDGMDSSSALCWSAQETTADDIIITADVYVVDSSNNRPFNKVEVKCTMSKTVTVDNLVYSVTETALQGPEETAAATTLAVQAWANGATDSSGSFAIGGEMFFFIEPPAIHSELIFMPGSCTADGTTIDTTYDYHLADSDCGITDVDSQIGAGTYGVCMHIFAKPDGSSTTIACTASLDFSP